MMFVVDHVVCVCVVQRLVEFENEEGAERALRQLADSFLDNRKIMVRKVG